MDWKVMTNQLRAVFLTVSLCAPGVAQTQGRGPLVPSVSVRKPDNALFRTTAMKELGWRLGVRSDAFGPISFSEAAAKADAAGLSAIAGVSKNLDFNLGSDEVGKLKTRLQALRLRMPAYYLDTLPAGEAAQRKAFAFAKELGADLIVTPAEPASFAALDKLAGELDMHVAVAPSNPRSAMTALEPLSRRIGLSVKSSDSLQPLKDRVLAVNLRDSALPDSAFLVHLSQVQPPTLQSDWPPDKDGGAKKSEVKPLFFSLDPTGAPDPIADLSKAAAAYDKLVRPAIAWRIDTLSRVTTISKPDRLPADLRAKIDAAIPRQAIAKPKKPRKLLVMDLCVNGGYYHSSIPDGNLALELIGRYTGAYAPVFSNDLNNLRYPAIKKFDAIFLNNVEGEVFIDSEVMNSLIRYVNEGGGVAGLHAATWASTDVPEYGELMGSQTGAHKYNGEPGALRSEDPTSPLTEHFGTKTFEFLDEFYHFLPDGPYSREKLHILLSLDPARTDLPGNQYKTRPDNDYGMVWIRSYGKGRVFNCALGHKPDFYVDPRMEKLLLGATQFILGDLAADTTPSAKLANKH